MEPAEKAPVQEEEIKAAAEKVSKEIKEGNVTEEDLLKK